jgi:vacuolar-type H+-ATPase subunit E/Vma4
MPASQLPFGKIVATPTPTNWSQAYGAGGLFLTLSLTSKTGEHPEHLGALGKELINDLEAEYFSLEEKSLASLQEAIEKAFAQVPSDTSLSASFCVTKDAILYVFLLGGGAILLKRGDKTGAILKATEAIDTGIQSASGHLTNGDLIILVTKEFQALIPQQTLLEALKSNDAEDIAETLSPLVHGKEDGGSAAIFFTFTSTHSVPLEEQEEMDENESEAVIPQIIRHSEEDLTQQSTTQTATHAPFPTTETTFPHPTTFANQHPKRKFQLPRFPVKFNRLTHRQRLLGSIAFVLVLILFASIFYTMMQTRNQKAKDIFDKTYEPAKQYLDEGKGVIASGLNLQGARDDLTKAKDLVASAEKDIPKGTEEDKKLLALQKEIDDALMKTSGENAADLIPADKDSRLLTSLKTDGALFATKDDDYIYTLSPKTISQMPRDGTTSKTLIENDGDWTRPAGLGTFLGNLYVLDTKKGILKFVKGSNGYGSSTSYLSGSTKPSFTKAVSMAIDSSIYVLFSDGQIAKFTKGSGDTFSITGLTTPLSNPTRIFTLPDYTSVYILDNGNSRIVQLATNGAYKAQYQAGAIKNAKDFEVDEKNQKAYLLIDGKVYSMDLR